MKQSEIKKLKEQYHFWNVTDETAAEKVGWSDDKDQISRFKQFLKIQDYTGKLKDFGVLDVGCADGMFLSFLIDSLKTWKFSYTGIDFLEEYVGPVRDQYIRSSSVQLPKIKFIVGDFLTFDFNKKFDYVFASGIFNVNVFENHERAYEVMFETVTKMLDLAKVAVVFNFLSTKEFNGEILTSEMVAFDPGKVREHFKGRVKNAILIKGGYDGFDSTLFLIKN